MNNVTWILNLNQIFAIIFFGIFFIWMIFKLRNLVLLMKLKCKDLYKDIKRDSKKTKVSKNLFKVFLFLITILWVYSCIAVGCIIFLIMMVFFTLGGAAFVDTGADPTFYNNFMEFVPKFLIPLLYIHYYIYLVVCVLIVRAIYINNLIHKELSDKSKEETIEKQNDINK